MSDVKLPSLPEPAPRPGDERPVGFAGFQMHAYATATAEAHAAQLAERVRVLEAALHNMIEEAFDRVTVHPCDVDNEQAYADQCSEVVRDAYRILKGTP